MKLEDKKFEEALENDVVGLDGKKRPRIATKILYKKRRPSLAYDEEDIFGLVNFLCEGKEEAAAREDLVEFIVELCEQYETEEWGGDAINLYTSLLQIDWEIGARKKRERYIDFLKKEQKQMLRKKERELVLSGFKMWQNGDASKTAYAFCKAIGEYNEYGMCLSKIKKYLSPGYKEEKLIVEEETSCPEFLSNLKNADLLMLKKFTVYLCFASLNLCLGATLCNYIHMLRYGKFSHHGNACKHYTVLQDGYSEFEYVEEKRKKGLL